MTDTPALEALLERLRDAAAADRDPETTPDVGIIMGSDSDLPVMRGAHDALVDLGFEEDTGDGTDARFSFESYVVSAHRTPDLMDVYVCIAVHRGSQVSSFLPRRSAVDL
jgi:5-(carboxyamino)imidazole ribonucleotide mutase